MQAGPAGLHEVLMAMTRLSVLNLSNSFTSLSWQLPALATTRLTYLNLRSSQ